VIGIKLANGEFYPVLNEDDRRTRTMVLTTVRDDQNNVQIDLFRGEAHAGLAEAEYIASLVLENIRSAPRGELDIHLSMNIDTQGNLNASAREQATGEHQSLSVSLDYLESSMFELPDLDVEDGDGELAAADIRPPEPAPPVYEEEPREEREPDSPVESRSAHHPLLFAAFLLLGLGVLAALLYLVFQLLKGDPVPALKAAADALVPAFPARS
jgi:hypothetical protein